MSASSDNTPSNPLLSLALAGVALLGVVGAFLSLDQTTAMPKGATDIVQGRAPEPMAGEADSSGETVMFEVPEATTQMEVDVVEIASPKALHAESSAAATEFADPPAAMEGAANGMPASSSEDSPFTPTELARPVTSSTPDYPAAHRSPHSSWPAQAPYLPQASGYYASPVQPAYFPPSYPPQ